MWRGFSPAHSESSNRAYVAIDTAVISRSPPHSMTGSS
nr:MAG TPA: hypothetical protein [Caudoviricetes sp.]